MKRSWLGAALFSSFVLVGCGTLSQVDSKGETDNPVFPEIDKVTFEVGSYPNIENLRQVQKGVTRDQLYNLLGRPHFSEGFKVREWDYLFHFNTPQGVKTCQFKVLFDKDKLGQSFYWKPSECASVLDDTPKPEPERSLSLSGDVAFAFGSAVLTSAGLGKISELVDQLGQVNELERVVVSGHTDHIGSSAFNQRLSQQRAEAVRQALISAGIKPNIILAQGFGDQHPLVHCDQGNRSDLIACLAPNRRVEIVINAIK